VGIVEGSRGYVRGPLTRDAGVVDEDIEPARLAPHPLGEALRARRIGDVERLTLGRELPTVRQRSCGVRRRIRIACGHDHVMTQLRELTSDLAANPSVRPAHEGHESFTLHDRQTTPP
jgi:hypothetical protein